MTVKKLQEMYEQSEDKEKLKVSDYLKQLIELKEKNSNFLKYLDERINNLEKTVNDFKLGKNDIATITLTVLKEVKSHFV